MLIVWNDMIIENTTIVENKDEVLKLGIRQKQKLRDCNSVFSTKNQCMD